MKVIRFKLELTLLYNNLDSRSSLQVFCCESLPVEVSFDIAFMSKKGGN